MWSAEEILHYWFGDLDDDGLPDTDRQRVWFKPDRSEDQDIRRRFMGMVTLAREGGLDHWAQSATGTLAAIILLDQFPRQIYRGMSLAFDSDKQAREWMKHGLACGQDLRLPLIQRAFFYMPCQHAEQRAWQAQGIELYEQLVHQSHGRLREVLAGFLGSARQHHDIIDRFGRFPHRNAILGRPATAEEKEWLTEGGHRFGQ